MGSAVIFSGNDVKTLKSNIDINGSNKILSGSVDPTSTATTANPGSLYLNNSTGKVYRKLDSGSSTNWQEVGAGSSGKNYILSNDGSATTGWATYADAAGVRPVDGTGGSPNVTWTTTTSSPLDGLSSFLFTKDAANRQGQGVAYVFTIDSADQAKVLNIGFNYTIASGTFVGSAINTTNSDLIVYLYDVTNSSLIEPSLLVIDGANTGTNLKFKSSFQASGTSTSYRLIFHVATTSASAYTVKIDDVVVGPSDILSSSGLIAARIYETGAQSIPNNTDTKITFNNKSFDTTNSADVVTNNRWTAPVGGLYQINGSVRFNANTTGGREVDIWKNGVTIAATLISAPSNSVLHTLNVSDTQQLVAGDYIELACSQNSGGALGLSSDSNNTFLSIVKVGDLAPSSTTGVIAARAITASAQSFNSSATTIVNFGTITGAYAFDTAAAVTTGASWKFTAPSAGYYSMFGSIVLSASGNWVAGDVLNMKFHKNGVEFAAQGSFIDATNTHELSATHGTTVYCNAGDYLDLRIRQINGSATARTLNSDDTENFICIHKIQNPSSFGQNVSVAAKVNTSSTSVGTTRAPVIFTVKEYDTHAAYSTSTGGYTVPVSGIYEVSSFVISNDTISSTTANLGAELALAKNSTTVPTSRFSQFMYQVTGVGLNPSYGGTCRINCVSGDVLYVLTKRDAGVSAFSLINTSDLTWASFSKVG